MSALTYESQALQWRPDNSGDRRFTLIISLVVVLALLLGVALSLIAVPQETRQIRAAVPERIAKFILENEKRKPQPKPEVTPPPTPKPKPEIKVEPPPEPEVIAEIKPGEPEPISQLKPQKPERTEVLTESQQKARAAAEKSGLLALGSELAELMDTSDVSNMARAKISTTTDSSTTVASVNTSVLTATASGGGSSVKIKPGDYTTTIPSAQLKQQERVKIASALTPEKNSAATTADEKSTDTKKQTTAGNGVRFEEDIYYVIDQNKGKLHAVYRQARRANPGLQGKIVFDITILASGKVSAVVVRSSELDDPALQERLISRLKSFDFGAREGGEMTVTYPIEFLP